MGAIVLYGVFGVVGVVLANTALDVERSAALRWAAALAVVAAALIEVVPGGRLWAATRIMPALVFAGLPVVVGAVIGGIVIVWGKR